MDTTEALSESSLKLLLRIRGEEWRNGNGQQSQFWTTELQQSEIGARLQIEELTASSHQKDVFVALFNCEAHFPGKKKKKMLPFALPTQFKPCALQ